MGLEAAPSTHTWSDTIAARATPPGVGAIGIIRVSGPDAWGIAGRVFRAEQAAPRGVRFRPGRPYLGVITSQTSDFPIDQVLVFISKAPKSYTGEDTVEIHCHGGPLVLREVLGRVLSEGARLAEPGEFTRRAVLNGKLDLAQAEAVLDVIEARSPAGLLAAVNQLGGGLSAELRGIREALVEARACIEAGLDFPEDGIQEEARAALLPLVEGARDRLSRLVATFRRGRVHRQGALAVLTGRPNVGKSSLFNRLLGRDRAIVTEHAGTTRDLIEEPILLDGIPFRLADSAGRAAPGPGGAPVDAAAAAIATRAADEADARIVVLDASGPLCPEDRDVLASAADRPGVLALNKCDLPAALDEEEARRGARGLEVVRVSALTGAGIGDLGRALARVVERGLAHPGAQGSLLVQDERHHDLLSKAADALDRAVGGLGAREGTGDVRPLDDELAAVELEEAAESVAQALGEGVDEEVLETVFRRFCVGK